MEKNTLPFKITIASPCAARWEDMGGDRKVRFCDHCRKNVYNLSAMTANEATALLQSTGGRLCARIYQRTDGTVLTEDCPVGIAAHWRRVKAFVAGGVATLLLGLVNLVAFGRGYGNETLDRPPGPILSAMDDTADFIRDILTGAHSTSKPMIGKMAAPTGMPVMGSIVAPTAIPTNAPPAHSQTNQPSKPNQPNAKN